MDTLQTQRGPREFTMRFSSSPRGARLARRLVSHRLDEWGFGYSDPVNEAVSLICGELAANAVRHGRVQGRDFEVQLTRTEAAVRIEVSDTRTERVPPTGPVPVPAEDSESGRGLLIVAALATDWGMHPRPAAPGKTVWAECAI
ncbi:ATP-binding protein [Kitasatospora viridis]|uniref:Anti-sigma regulatory factor (Ser/Thr protein kinase) n=1 Tax=Kitasatospora viridis TaxID=281105 RepID=A0A561TTT1_9ACTN|nr:anti-sigma regulatory factor (Ser/Thr protein kinase) [Kitasatospora viridis]